MDERRPNPADPAEPVAAEAGDRGAPVITAEEEPVTTGTFFIMVLFLMALAAMWGIMYLTLLDR